jgi:DNA repair protein SbcC/Rad50
MIPIRLKLSGFLSYREPAELDFTSFELACISGANGAGKSSLLDAITWSLFGQARKRDETLIHSAAAAAEVTFTFRYEENIYRVQRILPRGKGTLLEFQILDGGPTTVDRGVQTEDEGHGQPSTVNRLQGTWRPLTERTLRETQARIESILRLDYDTFVNASFFLQGKADQFTQQRPADRKRILASILGLETWEIYRERAAERRRNIERELDLLENRLAEINTELGEEPARAEHLAELEAQLKQMSEARKVQENALEAIKRMAASLAEQRKLVEASANALAHAREKQAADQARLAVREDEAADQADLVRRAAEVEAAYQAWQSARADLEKWEASEARFHEFEKRRQPHLDTINAEKARLEQEDQSLGAQSSAIDEQQVSLVQLKFEIETAQKALAEAEAQVTRRAEIDGKLHAERERAIALEAENKQLKIEMDELKLRIGKMSEIEGALCPLCGQPLSEEHRLSTLEQLSSEGKDKGDRWRANRTGMETITAELHNLETQLNALSQAENERLRHAGQVSSLVERMDGLQKSAAEWETRSAPRLAEIKKLLKDETYAAEARAELAKVDGELSALGYDAAAHDSARRAESTGRTAETDFRALEAARAALAPLEREIKELSTEIKNRQSEIDRQEDEYASAAAALAQAEHQAPDLDAAYDELLNLQENENRLRDEVGAARQKVSVLGDLRARKVELEADRHELAGEIGRHKTLERAFGKDGVPALLIEQALPQIEEKANELLERLSDSSTSGSMAVRFVTQAEYKDKKRDDLKETLDIQISDAAGTRDYEMFSGGEAFRVNFAIRLALSEVLARRTGARLQTLVIDEGFGSQDAQGRQRLVEAINLVKADFAKILVITHLEELKDAFPNRIEVEKTASGSTIRVI